jgi:outer membrane protein assembly factor BamB
VVKRFTTLLFITGLLVFLVSVGVNGETAGKSWFQWQGPNRDNKSAETNLLKSWPEDGPKMVWFVEGMAEGFSAVSIANGYIYTTGTVDKQGWIFAVDLEGNLKWKKMYGPEWAGRHPGARGTPTIDENNIYVIGGMGTVSCFEAKTGQEKWTVDPFKDSEGMLGRYGIAESALIIGEKLIFTPGGSKATMVALNKKTGETIWASKSIGEKSAYCSPILIERGGTKLIVTMTENSIIGVDAEDGNMLWQYDCEKYQGEPKDINPNTPVYHDGCIYVTSGYEKGGAKLKLSEDGKKIESQEWVNLKLDCHHGGVVLVDGYIYGSNMDGKWLCLNWDNGEIMYEKNWLGKGSITYAEEMLYCYAERGTVGLVKATPDDFTVVSSFKISKGDDEHWAHPVICDGRLYIRHGNALIAYDIKN